MKPKDIVRVTYKDKAQENRFWQTGEVTAVETLDGTEVIFVKFSDGETIGFKEMELTKIKGGK